MSSGDDLITSAFGRLVKLGGLATRVGVSLAAQQALGFMRSDPIRQMRKTENFVLNAVRVAEALGQLKGAAMKAGQMLSVYEGLLPPEVAAVLRGLQKEAPRVSFVAMERALRAELPHFDDLFEHLDPQAIAAASIGQVYRARLRDGREVAVKVQYPEIDRVVRSDLKNLKKLFGALFAMIAKVEFEPIWEEVRDRLLEELDYTHEASNIRRMQALHADLPEIVVPGVVEEASTRRVLTMDYVPGLSPDEACADDIPQELKNTWGARLLTFTLRGLLEHRFLHADPNLANFSFLEDGRLIVYDHGCMKAIDPQLVRGYKRTLRVLIDGDVAKLPACLHDMGVYKRTGDQPIPVELLEPIAELACAIVGIEPYRFSGENELYDTLFDMKLSEFNEYNDINLPPAMVFVNRTLGGLFGNLCRLGAEGRWREILAPYAERPTTLA
jgi:predicted unusual protein kinase regulating ubiquinone biosynthesis (AarF/ABC1/UbiB family)